MSACIEAMRGAFKALSAGKAELPLRSRIALEERDGTALFMPAYLSGEDREALAVKIVSVFGQNPRRGLPLIHAAVLVLDEATGQVEALIEGGSLTAIRTGAGSGAATDLLAREDASVLALFGAGVQAATQLEAVCSVRDIEEVRVYAPDEEQLQRFVEIQRGQGSIPTRVLASGSPKEALGGADIVCTATTSAKPVFADGDLEAGVHINAVGSYTPEMLEVPLESLERARIFVDSMEAAGVEAGEITQGLEGGAISRDGITEIGQALAKPGLGRKSAEEITLFKSVGVAVQDAAAGKLALANARRLGLGTEIEL